MKLYLGYILRMIEQCALTKYYARTLVTINQIRDIYNKMPRIKCIPFIVVIVMIVVLFTTPNAICCGAYHNYNVKLYLSYILRMIEQCVLTKYYARTLVTINQTRDTYNLIYQFTMTAGSVKMTGFDTTTEVFKCKHH